MSRTGWIGASATREQRVGRVAIYGVDIHTNNNVPDPCDAEAKAAAAICDLESGQVQVPCDEPQVPKCLDRRRNPRLGDSRAVGSNQCLGKGRTRVTRLLSSIHHPRPRLCAPSRISSTTLKGWSRKLKRQGEVCRGKPASLYIRTKRGRL